MENPLPAPRRRYGGKTAEQRRAERREALLAAAVDIWQESGWAAVTMRGVCARAGLTDRYFYESLRRPRRPARHDLGPDARRDAEDAARRDRALCRSPAPRPACAPRSTQWCTTSATSPSGPRSSSATMRAVRCWSNAAGRRPR
ncbi:TetR family transcriptional regulator [Nocardioides convexus]|uniref:TetR/AcrR family transcriptional regulator n=1 Tax=Nocardioides convexus TaxID=2712224 RepID=UPI0024186A19|nr:TetR family transcriptional regulator [Nocardioides convexus]